MNDIEFKTFLSNSKLEFDLIVIKSEKNYRNLNSKMKKLLYLI